MTRGRKNRNRKKRLHQEQSRAFLATVTLRMREAAEDARLRGAFRFAMENEDFLRVCLCQEVYQAQVEAMWPRWARTFRQPSGDAGDFLDPLVDI